MTLRLTKAAVFLQQAGTAAVVIHHFLKQPEFAKNVKFYASNGGEVYLKMHPSLDAVYPRNRCEVDQLLREYKPRQIVLGSSIDGWLDDYAEIYALKHNILRIKIIDSFINIESRFQDDQGELENSRVSDLILSPSVCVTQKLIDLGIARSNIKDYCHPVYNAPRTLSRKPDFFKKNGLENKNQFICLVYETGFQKLSNRHVDNDFNLVFELMSELIEEIVVFIEKFGLNSGHQLNLIVKAHPNDDISIEHQRRLNRLGGRCHILREVPEDDLIANSKIVLGLGSMMMIRASVICKHTFCYLSARGTEYPKASYFKHITTIKQRSEIAVMLGKYFHDINRKN